MNRFYKRQIAVALDHSPHSQKAFALGVELGRHLSLPVNAYYVLDLIAIEGWLLPEPGEGWVATSPSLSTAIENYLAERAKILENQVEARAREVEVPLSFQILRGVVSEELIRLSAESDLLLLGKKGEHSRFHNHLVGTVTERLSRHSHCPLIVAGEHKPHLERILVGLDGSEPSEHALKVAATLAKATGKRLYLASVDPDIKRAQERVEQGRNTLADLGIAIELAPLAGQHPKEALLSFAQKENVDLIAIGTQGKRRFFHLFFGSTASALLHHSPFHLLLARKPAHSQSSESLRHRSSSPKGSSS